MLGKLIFNKFGFQGITKNKFQIEKLACKKLKDNLEIYINKTQLISDYKNKLIE